MVKCNLCLSDKLGKLYRINGSNLKKCRNCGFVFISPVPSKERLKRMYMKENSYFSLPKQYDSNDPLNSLLKFNQLEVIDPLPLIKKYCKGGKLLDIGCANGIFLNKARAEGFECYGIDSNKKSVEFARNKLKLNRVYNTDSLKKFKSKSFDCVVMMQVLEHLPNPLQFIKEVKRILKEKGILVIATPDVESIYAKRIRTKWPMFHRLGHISFFSLCSLKFLLEVNKLEILENPKHMGYLYLPSPLREIDQSPLLQSFYTKTFFGNFRKLTMNKLKLGDNIMIIAGKK